MSTQKQQILKRCHLFFLMHRRDIIIFTILLHSFHHTYNHHYHYNHHSLPRHRLIMITTSKLDNSKRFENWVWKLYHVGRVSNRHSLYATTSRSWGQSKTSADKSFPVYVKHILPFYHFYAKNGNNTEYENVSWQNMASLACRHICHSNHFPERTKITK